MNENKRDYKQEIKDWWDEHKKVIKTGAKCLAVGLAIVFVKGMTVEAKHNGDVMCRLIDKLPSEPNEDDFVYDESTVDDPELLELIRSEE